VAYDDYGALLMDRPLATIDATAFAGALREVAT
jgi:hypothetical protein